MLITTRFVFVHIPKTGGGFVRQACLRNLPPEWVIDHEVAKHAPDTAIPAAQAHLPRFALVRNPWDWHVSWYHYLLGAGRSEDHRERVRSRKQWFIELTDDFTADFGTAMRRLYDVSRAAGRPAHLRRAATERVDLLTLHLRRQTGSSQALGLMTMGRSENLRNDLRDFLVAQGVPVGPDFESDLFRRPPANRTSHTRYQDYYDPELRDLIGELAADTIARYGYTFDGPSGGPAAEPTTPAGASEEDTRAR